MNNEIIWTKDASDDLYDIISFIKQNSGLSIAKNIYSKFKTKVDNLIIFPELGTVVPELKNIGINYIKQMVISPWKVYYKSDNNKIIILSIIDSRRNLEDILIEKLIKSKKI